MRPTGNFYGGGGLTSNNFVNNFSAGSNADISQSAVMKHEEKGSASTEDIYGTSTAAASKPQINFNKSESMNGSIKSSGTSKMMLN